MTAPDETIRPPWDLATVETLNSYQIDSGFHPFTCPASPHGRKAKQFLLATSGGWICPDCDYTQDWAHAFMADPEVQRLRREELENTQ